MSKKKILAGNKFSAIKVFEAFIFALMITIVIFLLSLFNIKDAWPATIALLFFFEGKAETGNLKKIFLGAATGLILASFLPKCVKIMTPVFGNEPGILLTVFFFIFLIIALGNLVQLIFNNYAFCFFTIALIYQEQDTISWMLSLLLGGGLLVGSSYLFIKYLPKIEEI